MPFSGYKSSSAEPQSKNVSLNVRLRFQVIGKSGIYVPFSCLLHIRLDPQAEKLKHEHPFLYTQDTLH